MRYTEAALEDSGRVHVLLLQRETGISRLISEIAIFMRERKEAKENVQSRTTVSFLSHPTGELPISVIY